ncbi:MAG: PSD1 and planctomycete cytochrome C domain-containing protein [Pirellulales bacterium]|nr:PSD1 and planctomycete cytochrome C domain-containing protein [Pirellulales bacterium]
MRLRRGAAFSFCLIAWALGFVCQARADDEAREFFEKQVRPILVARCYACHSGEKASGGLSLETRALWQRGGESGAAIVPGKPDESLLIDAINYRSLEMPPRDKGAKLSEAEIAVLTTWVARGAFDPREEHARIAGMSVEQARHWWSFQSLPPADDRATPAIIDQFIDANLALAGLTADPPADRRTLIRRATYDLTGLPPTAAEVATFVADESPDAYARLIDRLLASPQYGIRWGRHWLDAVRYADTAGENTDRPLPHAWRYRNWVFGAFDRDLPYDEFVHMQLAGDLMRANSSLPQRREGIIATGYLAIARRFGHDIDKDIHLTYEDVIDNVCKVFLGLTGGCARCHDHKYDPITSADYYALYGIFDSTRFSFPGCEPKGQPRDLVPLLTEAEYAVMTAPWKAAVAGREQARQAKIAGDRAKLKRYTDGTCRVIAQAPVGEGQSVPFADPASDALRVVLRKGEVLQLTVFPNANHGADSTLVDWSIEDTTKSTGATAKRWSVTELAADLTRGNPLRTAHEASWCFLDVTDGAALLDEKQDVVSGHAELHAWRLGELPSAFVNSSPQPVDAWTKLPGHSFFVHPGPDRPVGVAWICPYDGEFRIAGSVTDAHPAGLDGVSFELLHCANAEYGAALLEVGTAPREPGLDPGPEPAMPVAFAAVDGTPHDVPMQQRGEPEKPGEVVPRRFLTVFGAQPLPAGAGSGRAELARWITEQPLAARVMVNRIWQGHFGQGLARSLNDFGSRGERPTHPELLGWLSARFVASGYSIKQMHRLIMHSAAYHRSSARAAATVAADPDNRLLARFERRRLSAEEIRDSLLMAAGVLDLQPAEAHPFPPEASWTFTQHNPFSAVYETNKRSAFLMVQRQRRHPFLAQFDGADPNASTPRRETTTVPTQALYFMNDSFFHQQAERFAGRLLNRATTDSRIDAAYSELFQRGPTDLEQQRAEMFVANYPGTPAEAWAGFARTLLASNEFLYVD